MAGRHRGSPAGLDEPVARFGSDLTEASNGRLARVGVRNRRAQNDRKMTLCAREMQRPESVPCGSNLVAPTSLRKKPFGEIRRRALLFSARHFYHIE
jgi:hypothetical protein